MRTNTTTNQSGGGSGKTCCCPTCGSEQPVPPRYPLGTRVSHPKHGKGKIFSYEQCDEFSCGVDFGRKGQWCIALRELTIHPSAKKVRSSDPYFTSAPFTMPCPETGKWINKGDKCVYYPSEGKWYHVKSKAAGKARFSC